MRAKIQNITVVAVAAAIVCAIAAYSYSADQTRQKVLQFGIELEQIQEKVKDIQTRFYSEKTRWEEGEISRDELLRYYEGHIGEFEGIISEYDKLEPPELFRSSIELLKISSQTQLESDTHLIEWIRTGDEAARARSDIQIQESLEYEMRGLVEFYSAKTGTTNYDEPEKFEAPQSGLVQRVLQVTESMKERCDEEFGDGSGGFDSDSAEVEWFNCVNEAQKWKEEHLP